MQLRTRIRTTTKRTNDPVYRRMPVIRLALIGVVLALVAAACGGDSADMAATTAAPVTTSAPDSAGEVRPPGDRVTGAGGGAAQEDGVGGDGGIAPTALPSNIDRDIIFTADLQIAVTDVAAAGVEATQKIQALGGFLFGQQTVGGNEPRSILVFKIIPEQFQTALDQLGAIGEVRNQTISADDVTERIVDLGSQITTIEASVERLRALLEGVGTVEELAQLESQLLERETRLEQLRGSLTTLQNQVALATITLRIDPARIRPGVELLSSAYPGFEDEGSSCPGNAQQLIVDRGTTATVCWEIRNSGDTDLTNFQLTDTVLDVTLDDLLVVAGDPDQPLRPGQSVIVAFGAEVDRRTRTQTRVSAEPVTADGVVLADLPVASTTSITLIGEDAGGIPGFGEGVSRSWRALIGFAKVVILAAGLALPFLWVPVVLYLLGIWLRRRNEARGAAAAAALPPMPTPRATTQTEVAPGESDTETEAEHS